MPFFYGLGEFCDPKCQWNWFNIHGVAKQSQLGGSIFDLSSLAQKRKVCIWYKIDLNKAVWRLSKVVCQMRPWETSRPHHLQRQTSSTYTKLMNIRKDTQQVKIILDARVKQNTNTCSESLRSRAWRMEMKDGWTSSPYLNRWQFHLQVTGGKNKDTGAKIYVTGIPLTAPMSAQQFIAETVSQYANTQEVPVTPWATYLNTH